MYLCSQGTIVALATPPGVGALAVLRVSGEKLAPLYRRLTRSVPKNRFALFCKLYHPTNGDVLDEVVATYFKSPNSFTGEDMIEVSCHGGEAVQNNIISALLDDNIRLANPGEFSFRAYMNGKMDLLQAEAVASLISSKSSYSNKIGLQHLEGKVSQRLSSIKLKATNLLAIIENELNFSDDEIDKTSIENIEHRIKGLCNEIEKIVEASAFGRQIFSGVRVVFFGRPNSGKSSLFNTLVGYDRAIVSSTPGTTRDTVEAWIELKGIPVCLVDTAGVWESEEYLDALGVEKTRSEIERADLCLLIDENDPVDLKNENITSPVVLVRSKCDNQKPTTISNDIINVSSKKSQGIQELLTHISTFCSQSAGVSGGGSSVVMITRRQRGLLKKSHGILCEALEQSRENIGTDILSSTLRQFVVCIQDVIGEIPNENIMKTVFSTFCIGK